MLSLPITRSKPLPSTGLGAGALLVVMVLGVMAGSTKVGVGSVVDSLWDHVVGLAAFPGFAELKRSLRERPQLRALGVDVDSVGVEEDWHGGSRRLKK